MPDYPVVSETPTDHVSASEFGGLEGLVQPPPHVPDASEQLMLGYQLTMEPITSE